MLCKCGNKAIYNAEKDEWEMCPVCRKNLYRANISNALQEMGFGKKYRNASFTSYTDKFLGTLKSDLRGFTRNLLLYGDSAVGKTYLLASIASALLESGVSEDKIAYYNTVALFCSIGQDITTMHDIVERCSTVQYLFLDEVCNPKTEWENRMLYLMLDNRKNDELITYSATKFNPDELDGRIGTRLLENDGCSYKITTGIWRKE